MISAAILSALVSAGTVIAQNPRVHVGKSARAIPEVCELIAPASLEGRVDVAGLVKEAKCKGAGDMIVDYTYVLKATRREKDRKGLEKEKTTTYEVYAPTLKGGTRTRGILLTTSRDGVPVPPDELAKERLRAGERLGKEESRISRQPSPPGETNPDRMSGMLPLGMYPQVRVAGTSFVLQNILDACELTLARRESVDGRETLVFSFAPRPGAQFNDNEKYVALLNGTIRIDAQDRIVTRLDAWQSSVKDRTSGGAAQPPGGNPPAVHLEMTRLPEGVWLPGVVRLNGADYPTLFDGVTYDISHSFSEYKRFVTETKDVRLEPPKIPR